MDILFHLSSNIDNPVMILPKTITWSMQKQRKINILPCRSSKSIMGKGKNYYKVLSLDSEDVGLDEIKRAYRSMALRYHPDVCSPCTSEESTRMFVELQRAYETLSDPVSRKKHDHELLLFDYKERTWKDDGARSRFPKEVWEVQLCELNKRSNERVERRKNVFM